MTQVPGQKDRIGHLRELSDPEFFAHWAMVRHRLFFVPKGKPGHCEVKRWYDAVSAEYRRRIDGGFAVADSGK
jgi:hypothetical protein